MSCYLSEIESNDSNSTKIVGTDCRGDGDSGSEFEAGLVQHGDCRVDGAALELGGLVRHAEVVAVEGEGEESSVHVEDDAEHALVLEADSVRLALGECKEKRSYGGVAAVPQGADGVVGEAELVVGEAGVEVEGLVLGHADLDLVLGDVVRQDLPVVDAAHEPLARQGRAEHVLLLDQLHHEPVGLDRLRVVVERERRRTLSQARHHRRPSHVQTRRALRVPQGLLLNRVQPLLDVLLHLGERLRLQLRQDAPQQVALRAARILLVVQRRALRLAQLVVQARLVRELHLLLLPNQCWRLLSHFRHHLVPLALQLRQDLRIHLTDRLAPALNAFHRAWLEEVHQAAPAVRRPARLTRQRVARRIKANYTSQWSKHPDKFVEILFSIIISSSLNLDLFLQLLQLLSDHLPVLLLHPPRAAVPKFNHHHQTPLPDEDRALVLIYLRRKVLRLYRRDYPDLHFRLVYLQIRRYLRIRELELVLSHHSQMLNSH